MCRPVRRRRHRAKVANGTFCKAPSATTASVCCDAHEARRQRRAGRTRAERCEFRRGLLLAGGKAPLHRRQPRAETVCSTALTDTLSRRVRVRLVQAGERRASGQQKSPRRSWRVRRANTRARHFVRVEQRLLDLRERQRLGTATVKAQIGGANSSATSSDRDSHHRRRAAPAREAVRSAPGASLASLNAAT